ncbi:hypothetical protein [Terracidiphilus sp.]|jgi:hypothetical protein|uniref:hypothetical protein n=1 Tax=Terracidiphilus sp. TaxID=1964191 RepID=UPI003C28FC83
MPADNSYDWLGPGVYFWENDPIRAYRWAQLPWRKINLPSIVSAVIDPGRCLDLTTQEGIEAVRSAHEGLSELHKLTGEQLPANTGVEKGKRNLDCAVIKHLHRARKKMAESDPTVQPYQTVRALFAEGEPLYEEAGFHDRTHVQICVIDLRQILGVFRLPDWQQKSLGIKENIYPWT